MPRNTDRDDVKINSGRLTGVSNIQLTQNRQTSRASDVDKFKKGKDKISYGAEFIPEKHIERGTNFSNGNRRTYGTVGHATSNSGSKSK